MSFKYMKTPIGTFIWDQTKEDIHEMFTIITKRQSIKETLQVLITGSNPGFIDSTGKGFKLKDDPNKFFEDYLPRVFNFNPKVETAETRDEIPESGWSL